MPLFSTPMMIATPLLKIPLLFTYCVCTWDGMTPPNQMAHLKVKGNDFMTRTMNVHFLATAAAKYLLCGLSLVEAAVILAAYAETPLPFSPLLPSSSVASALRLTPLSLAACVFGIVGGLTRMWCHRALGRFFTWQVTIRDDHELVTSGPYTLVRHPSYLGWLLMVVGNLLTIFNPNSYFAASGLLGTLAGKALAGAVVLHHANVLGSMVVRAPQEDALLRKEFGAQWDEWARRTPSKMVPFVY